MKREQRQPDAEGLKDSVYSRTPASGGGGTRNPGGDLWRARGERAYPGVWGRSPQRGLGAEPLVGGSGGRSPPEAESFSAFELPTEQQNFPRFPYSAVFRSSDNLLLGIHNTAPKLLALLH